MTKHQPATPLPWFVDTHTRERINSGSAIREKLCEQVAQCNVIVWQENSAVESERARFKDAAYLVHAANAYPRLVEALRNLAERCDGAEGVRDDGSNIDTSDAAGLLMELGERE